MTILFSVRGDTTAVIYQLYPHEMLKKHGPQQLRQRQLECCEGGTRTQTYDNASTTSAAGLDCLSKGSHGCESTRHQTGLDVTAQGVVESRPCPGEVRRYRISSRFCQNAGILKLEDLEAASAALTIRVRALWECVVPSRDVPAYLLNGSRVFPAMCEIVPGRIRAKRILNAIDSSHITKLCRIQGRFERDSSPGQKKDSQDLGFV